MAEVSQTDAERAEQSDQEDPSTLVDFYTLCYEQRLKWTRKLVPVRYRDTHGFFMPGYLTTISAKLRPDQLVSVIPAFTPVFLPSRIKVKAGDLYPTASKHSQIDLETGELQLVDPIDLDRWEGTEPEKILAGDQAFELFFMSYPSLAWTEDEVLTAVRAKEECRAEFHKFKENRLRVTGSRNCIITKRKAEVLKMSNQIAPAREGETIQDVRAAYSNCQECTLGEKRCDRGQITVFGRGNPKAKAMIIGEAPGILEERDNSPFHVNAPAGGVLQRVMHRAGLDQAEWFFTNAVICRPEPPDGSRQQNGKPNAGHIRACSTRLKRTLLAVAPKLIVLAGATAYRAFFGRDPEGGVKKNLGWQECDNYKVYFAYHPSYIVRVENIPTTGMDEKRAYLAAWKEIEEAYRDL